YMFFSIDRGHFGKVQLDGLRWGGLFMWPGPIHMGGGTAMAVVDERASADQRAAIEAVAQGKETEPGSLITQVFSTMITTGLPRAVRGARDGGFRPPATGGFRCVRPRARRVEPAAAGGGRRPRRCGRDRVALSGPDLARHVRRDERTLALDDAGGVGRPLFRADVRDVGGDDGGHDAAERRAGDPALRARAAEQPA